MYSVLIVAVLSLLGQPGTDFYKLFLTMQAKPTANERTEILIHQFDWTGPIRTEWIRDWKVDQPAHMTYERIHGGIGP